MMYMYVVRTSHSVPDEPDDAAAIVREQVHPVLDGAPERSDQETNHAASDRHYKSRFECRYNWKVTKT